MQLYFRYISKPVSSAVDSVSGSEFPEVMITVKETREYIKTGKTTLFKVVLNTILPLKKINIFQKQAN